MKWLQINIKVLKHYSFEREIIKLYSIDIQLTSCMR